MRGLLSSPFGRGLLSPLFLALSLLVGLTQAHAQAGRDSPGNFNARRLEALQGQWVGQGNEQCNLKDAPNVLVDARDCSIFKLTLGGNRLLTNPTGLKNNEFITFLIKQPAAGATFQLTYGSMYNWPGSITPALTPTNGAKDMLSCMFDADDQQLACGAPQYAIAGGGVPAMLRSTSGHVAAAGTTLNLSLSGYAGHPILFGTSVCDGGVCATGGTAKVTSITDSQGSACSAVPNTLFQNDFITEIWKCTGGTSGTDSIVITCSNGTSGCNYMTVIAAEFSVIGGTSECGNKNEVSANNISLSTSCTTTGSNEVILSYVTATGGTPATPGQTLIASQDVGTLSYQIGPTPAVYSNSYTVSGTQTLAMSIAAFK